MSTGYSSSASGSLKKLGLILLAAAAGTAVWMNKDPLIDALDNNSPNKYLYEPATASRIADYYLSVFLPARAAEKGFSTFDFKTGEKEQIRDFIIKYESLSINAQDGIDYLVPLLNDDEKKKMTARIAALQSDNKPLLEAIIDANIEWREQKNKELGNKVDLTPTRAIIEANLRNWKFNETYGRPTAEQIAERAAHLFPRRSDIKDERADKRKESMMQGCTKLEYLTANDSMLARGSMSYYLCRQTIIEQASYILVRKAEPVVKPAP